MNYKIQTIAFWTLIYREMARVFRIWPQTLLPSAITTVLYFIIFGHVLGSHVGAIEGFPYVQFILPGLIFMPMVMGAYMNTSTSFFGGKFGKHIEELLVSPATNTVILLGYVGAGMLRGLMVGLLVGGMLMLMVPFHIYSWGVVLLVSFLMTAIFSLAGLINAIYAKKFDDVSFVPTFVLTPLNYFAGVFYSIKMLPPSWQVFSRFNPMMYLMDGLRYGFLGIAPDASFMGILAVMLGITAILTVMCLRLLMKSKGLRN